MARRYIDANELQKRLAQIANEPDYLHEGETWDTGVCLAGTQVDLIPTADVVEVKHGEWVDKFNNKYDNQVYVCSECGEKAYIKFVLNELGNTTYTQALTPFCPTCGADMRGDKNDL